MQLLERVVTTATAVQRPQQAPFWFMRHPGFECGKKANPRCICSGGLGIKPLAMTYSRMA